MVKKKVTELPEATAVGTADKLLISQGGVSKQASATYLTGAQGRLVFEWNQADLTQFDGATPSFRTASGGVAGGLSVVATAEHGNVLRYTGGGGVAVCETFLATAPLVFDGDRRYFTVEIESFDANTTSVGFGGAAVFCDETGVNFNGIVIGGSAGINGYSAIVNNGVLAEGQALTIGEQLESYQIRGRKPAASPPAFTLFLAGFNNSNATSRVKRTGSDVSARGSVDDLLSNTTFNASWDALPCDRWGLGIYSRSGGAPPVTWDILSIRVYVA